MDCALALVAKGWAVKPVCDALGVARSNVIRLINRPADWVDQRTVKTPDEDALLAVQLFEQIVELPSYGYRRACALLNRSRRANGLPKVNHKRAYRIMKASDLLLPKSAKRRPKGNPHSGVVAVAQSDLRWCSDGFEINSLTKLILDRCDQGLKVLPLGGGARAVSHILRLKTADIITVQDPEMANVIGMIKDI